MTPNFDNHSVPATSQPHHHQQGQRAQNFLFDAEAQGLRKAKIPSYSPAYSPTSSIAQSFDMHPPVLSSTSDSGASVQSNISSAMGSPSMDVPQQAPAWNQLHELFPSIVQQDNFQPDQFTSTCYDFDSLVAPDSKYPGFVGEPSRISSSQSSVSFFRTSPFSTSSLSAAKGISNIDVVTGSAGSHRMGNVSYQLPSGPSPKGAFRRALSLVLVLVLFRFCIPTGSSYLRSNTLVRFLLLSTLSFLLSNTSLCFLSGSPTEGC